ncbi:hypothetical protein DEU56DRAFT_902000 [Suillus clintonianus]|uniref:uncharacterized protein n=1 Tax=Suillus clintonianus TaxID=1904413 RepID=UPI001B87730F|nr:uncharacterized protein DEU56DRAFT_902000 [Suillus clintonianus]KAG2134467.1 hypothetical protein DEU56DRAFT_902000 [Suillus clintonianus]
MHRALLIDDILHIILHNVKSSTVDLRNLALTCTALSAPALNMLWCLPQDTWEVGEHNVIKMLREPQLAEWERVRMNASRTRRIVRNRSHTFFRFPRLRGPGLQRLFRLMPPALLFPNLRALNFDALPEVGSNFVLLRQFFSPRLEELSFNVPPDVTMHEVEQLFDALRAEAAGLRQLSIKANHGTSALHCTLPQSVGKLPKLNRLVIDRIDTRSIVQNITNIQHTRCLQTLTLTLCKTSRDVEGQPSGNTPLELRTLKHLFLVGTNLRQCVFLLFQVTTPYLSTIDISYHIPATPMEITAFITCLSMSCQTFAFLENISVVDDSLYRTWQHPDSYGPLPSYIFRPLLEFRRLSTVNFVAVGNNCLDDGFIEDAGVAWPDILELRFISAKPVPSEVTFTAMLSLASRCRSLHSLHLAFDATHLPTLPHAPDGNREVWRAQTALRELHVGHSKVSEAAHVHFFLAMVFPNLADFAWYDSLNPSDITVWQEIVRLWKQEVNLRATAPNRAVSLPDFLLESLSEAEDGVGEHGNLLQGL